MDLEAQDFTPSPEVGICTAVSCFRADVQMCFRLCKFCVSFAGDVLMMCMCSWACRGEERLRRQLWTLQMECPSLPVIVPFDWPVVVPFGLCQSNPWPRHRCVERRAEQAEDRQKAQGLAAASRRPCGHCQKGSRMEGCSMEETAKTYKHFPFCKVCSFFCVLLSILVGFFLCSFHPSVFLRLRDLRGAHVLALSQDEAADIENI